MAIATALSGIVAASVILFGWTMMAVFAVMVAMLFPSFLRTACLVFSYAFCGLLDVVILSVGIVLGALIDGVRALLHLLGYTEQEDS